MNGAVPIGSDCGRGRDCGRGQDPDLGRGGMWFRRLTGHEGLTADLPATVRAADVFLGGGDARFIAVVPDAGNRFPRARRGEMGLDEAWALSGMLHAVVAQDRGHRPRAIVAIVDVTSQAYGRLEEQLGLHLACAAAVDAYASARLAGHAVIALLVGKAMSGAFLAHGYQANRLIALHDPGVMVHAMGPEAAARITRRTADDLAQLAQECPPMAYDIGTFAQWGLLHALIRGVNADQPTDGDVERVRQSLRAAIVDVGSGPRDLRCRLNAGRQASLRVRERLAAAWDGD